ncbi:MAG: hypothetical protein ACKVZ0_21585 [Gemmatimonadales bacterium]
MRIDGPAAPIGGLGRIADTPPPPRDKASLATHLSAEEQAYFAELERIGPLVYGRRPNGAGTSPPPVLGQRVDVRA